MSHSKVLGYQVMIDSEVQGVLTLDMQVVNNVNLQNIIHSKGDCTSEASKLGECIKVATLSD